MHKIKISELFYSIQGEGRYMGVPSVFLRVFGCNLTCGGFGMPRGKISAERDVIAVNVEKYKDYKDLPLVTSGCDSYASWDTRFKHLSPLRTTEDIANSICDLLPKKEWQDEHLVITGGEPLLGWQRMYPELLNRENMQGLKELTFETNGTQHLRNDVKLFLELWGQRNDREVTFSVSPKLPGSGELWEQAIQPWIIADLQTVGYTYLKFVIATPEDLEDARRAVDQYRKAGFRGPVYVMPVGGVESVYSLNNRNVAEMAMNEGWRYSDRLQVPLFKNEWGT